MNVPDRRERRRRRLMARGDVYSVDLPMFQDRGDSPAFPPAYTDSGAVDGTPDLVAIPGGPGFAYVVPYAYHRPVSCGLASGS